MTILVPSSRPLPRLTKRGLASMALFYLGFGAFYAATIAYTVRDVQPNALAFYLGRVLLLDYPLKAALTLPVWWLLFRGPWRAWEWPRRLLAHVVLAPAWVGGWFCVYYGLMHALGMGGMGGNGRVWDIYIPTLFYGVQFGILHVVEFTQQLRWQSSRENLLQAQAHQSAVAALKAQINPHFLFNTLNSISASVPPELETTRELIARLAHTFRFALDASRHDLLPLADEVAFLRAYLALEQARFGARLQVHFAVDPALLRVLIPPMLLQPLVENAVRHGLGAQVAGGTVSVTVSAHGPAAVYVAVGDTGVGVGQSLAELGQATPGVGLPNTHARLLALGSKGLSIAENLPQGLLVSFVLPLSSPLPVRAPVAAAPPTSVFASL